jgi:hypothetical protein
MGFSPLCKQGTELDMGFGFLLGFPTRTLAGGFAEFHETGRKSPGPITRLDRVAAKQHLLAPKGDRARDRSRLDVVDRAARIAARPFARIAGRHATPYAMAASRAESDIGSNGHCKSVATAGDCQRAGDVTSWKLLLHRANALAVTGEARQGGVCGFVRAWSFAAISAGITKNV